MEQAEWQPKSLAQAVVVVVVGGGGGGGGTGCGADDDLAEHQPVLPRPGGHNPGCRPQPGHPQLFQCRPV